jgi:probable F420-dependent oxidoreductase
MDLGRIGVWWSGSWRVAVEPAPEGGDKNEANSRDNSDANSGANGDSGSDVAAELEDLGYGTLWSSGGFDPGLSPVFGRLLASTSRVAVASGIVSMFTGTPADVGPAVADLEAEYPGRFLLGIGASHALMVSDYSRPYSRMVAYLDALDALEWPVPVERRILAALGPRMLELAAQRAAGAHPYFVPVEHTVRARSTLGPGPLLAPEVAVVLEADPTAARALARGYASLYLGLPNYTQNLRTFGYGDEDIDGGGSDRLIDALFPWGDATTIAGRIREHHDAGADHVCIQVISASGRDGFPLAEYRELAEVLFQG